MMRWSRAHTLIAGAALIVLTNAIALVGVAYNRSGEPDSTLTLTRRELQMSYRWWRDRENSGIALRLLWRMHNRGESRVALMPGVTFFWLLDTSISFNRFILIQLNERLGQFMGAFEHDRLDQPEARVAHTIADMLHPQLYPSREGRIEISLVHRGKGSVRLCRFWRNPG